MSRYVLNTPTTKATKLAAKKFGSFKIETDRIKGEIEIVNYRLYTVHQEVDVIFKGKIFAKANNNREWLDSEQIKRLGKRISKVKLNRFIRKSCIVEVQHRMNYFGADIRYYNDIKKLTWI
jgi:hypothetical protein